MAYLVEQYGERTLSGTIEGPDVDYVRKVTGQSPAIVAADMINLTTSSDPLCGRGSRRKPNR